MNEPSPGDVAGGTGVPHEGTPTNHQEIWTEPAHAADTEKTAPQETGPTQV
jgi:hypothetical protein